MPRHKQTKVHMFKFTVEGSGRFPTDMLRYDSCWPVHENEARSLAMVRAAGPRRSVTLKRAAVNGCGPTIARWRNFDWTVTDVEAIS